MSTNKIAVSLIFSSEFCLEKSGDGSMIIRHRSPAPGRSALNTCRDLDGKVCRAAHGRKSHERVQPNILTKFTLPWAMRILNCTPRR